MRNNDTNGRANRPTCTWVEVKDAAGRKHLEARWAVPSMAAVAAPHAA